METKKLQLEITALAFGGDGVGAMPDGKKCFVSGGLPGDLAEVEIIQEKARFARGKLLRLVQPSPNRVESFCPLRNGDMPCPSCVYAELPYEEEIRWKQEQFRFFLTKGGFADPSVIRDPFPSPVRTGYRGKLTLSCENGKAGYRAADNTTLIPVTECALARKSINELLKETGITPQMKRLYFRWTLADGAVRRSFPEEKGAKIRTLTEQLGPYGNFLVPEKSFFQVNIPVACELIRRVMNRIGETDITCMTELYCGTGIFSLLAAERFPDLRTLGVELDPDAVRLAKANTTRRKLNERCRFQCRDAAEFVLPAGFDPERMLLLTDPPRTGMDAKLTERIRQLAPRYILYISCAPDMLRRDLERLGNVYRIQSAGLLDMFPATAHFESITFLERI